MISERLNRWWSKKRKWKEAKSKLKEWVYDKDMDLGIIGGGGGKNYEQSRDKI